MFSPMKLATVAIAVAAMVAPPVSAQTGSAGLQNRDTTVVPNAGFKAGGLHRRLLGDNWRDEWGTPITIFFGGSVFLV